MLQSVAPGINAHTTPTALFGVTAVIGGGYYLAMRRIGAILDALAAASLPVCSTDTAPDDGVARSPTGGKRGYCWLCSQAG